MSSRTHKFKRAPLGKVINNDDDLAFLCNIAAIRYCNRYPGQFNYEEFTGYIWIDLKKTYDRGKRDTALLFRRAYLSILTYIREILHGGGWGDYGRNKRFRIHCDSPNMKFYRQDKGHISKPQQTAYQRRLSIWCETRNKRIGIDMLSRIIMYLYYVERVKNEEIAKMVGWKSSWVSILRTRAVRKLGLMKITMLHTKYSKTKEM
jgi:hypothetical protein